MAQSFVDHHLALLGKALQLHVGLANLLTLLRREIRYELHAIQGPVTLLRRHVVELAQPLDKLSLTLRRQLFETRIALQQLFLLFGRKVLVGVQPFADSGLRLLAVLATLIAGIRVLLVALARRTEVFRRLLRYRSKAE